MKVNCSYTLPALTAVAVLLSMYMVRDPIQHSVFSFLSLNRPQKAKVLVIEGWLTDRMLKEATAEFVRGNYSYCLVVGKTRSSRTPRSILLRFGIDSAAVKFTDAETRKGHNTYHMARAARQWLQQNDPKLAALNVFTAGPHGRKSWTIFKRVFGQTYSVGVLSSTIERCDTALWWESNRGTRNMVKYGIGYTYAMLWPFGRS